LGLDYTLAKAVSAFGSIAQSTSGRGEKPHARTHALARICRFESGIIKPLQIATIRNAAFPAIETDVIQRRISIATKLNLTVAFPLVLAFVASTAAYLAIGEVSRDAALAVSSARLQQEANEFSATVDRIDRFMAQPGSQQQVAARIDPEIARLLEIAPGLANSMRAIDPGMAERMTQDLNGLDQFVLSTMLARGNITEANQMLSAMIGSFAEAASKFAGQLRVLPNDGGSRAEQFSARAGDLVAKVLAYSGAPDPDSFEATRKTVSEFADEIEAGVQFLKAAGAANRMSGREAESARAKIYGAVMQLGSSSERFGSLQARVTSTLDHAQAAVRMLKAGNELRSSSLLERISSRADLITLGAVLTLLAGIGIAIGAPLFVRQAIGRPLGRLQHAMKSLAQGNTACEIPEIDRSDAIGGMAKSVLVFRNGMQEAEQLRSDKAAIQLQAARQQRADLHRIAGRFQDAVGSMIDTVSSASTELEAAAGSLTAIAERTQKLSVTAAASFDQASSNVRVVAATTDNLDSSIVEIARQAHESSRIAAAAVQQAKATDAHIARLAASADRIGDVVKLISAIASQTNMLALNATIEAARAGNAGRGFAVVAQEVKALAARTAAATDEIGQQITGMQTMTKESVDAIREINSTIDRVADVASIILAAVEEQQVATASIARNLQQATQGASAVSDSIADVSRGAAATDTASASVLASARSLAGESARLKREVEKFLDTVRAA
jgi:methyl-accepting chemotaxis protein